MAVGLAYAEGNVIFPASTDSQVTYKLIINVGIMVMIAIGFFWSLWVTYHSADPKKVQTASDFVKMLFGFLLGSAKSFLGAP
jgi:hypothetical protein